jgi:aminopeptidase 2
MVAKLVAIVIAELDYIEADAFHVPIRIYAHPGKENDGKYALDLAVRTLKFYEETFGTPYPLPKMDMVA